MSSGDSLWNKQKVMAFVNLCSIRLYTLILSVKFVISLQESAIYGCVDELIFGKNYRKEAFEWAKQKTNRTFAMHLLKTHGKCWLWRKNPPCVWLRLNIKIKLNAYKIVEEVSVNGAHFESLGILESWRTAFFKVKLTNTTVS